MQHGRGVDGSAGEGAAGAAWHRSGQLVVPDSITIILLPPYSPE
jgi:hypothetical protein